MQGKVGKNAKKRLARAAFHASDDASGAMPYCLHVIEYRDGARRHIKFASLSSFKEYRERFYSKGQVGELRLVSDLSELDDSKGKANRSRVINQGIGINTGRESKPAFNRSAPKSRTVDGFRVTPQETFATVTHDIERERAIKGETVRVNRSHELKAIRQKYRSI